MPISSEANAPGFTGSGHIVKTTLLTEAPQEVHCQKQ